MRYGSVCAGVEAATVAWHPLGWEPKWFSEIEAFPRAVLTHHYPEIPLHGDFTTIQAGQYEPIDLLVGGTPCGSFSVAGLRGGLDDDRGNLALEYLRLADRLRPRWLVWENVPGVLSSNGGRDFGAILGGMVELGYGVAYRVLDAQFFGVAQRRRRVFVIGYLGDWRRAAAVLFERESLQRNHKTCGTTKKESTGSSEACAGGGSGLGTDAGLAGALTAGASGRNAGEGTIGCGIPLVANPLTARMHKGVNSTMDEGQTVITLVAQPVATFQQSSMKGRGTIGYDDSGIAKPVKTQVDGQMVHAAMQVRRITPVEAERLQGFPDNYTNIPWRGKPESPDGPRYKALGNSMAVPVMRWIGERIAKVDA